MVENVIRSSFFVVRTAQELRLIICWAVFDGRYFPIKKAPTWFQGAKLTKNEQRITNNDWGKGIDEKWDNRFQGSQHILLIQHEGYDEGGQDSDSDDCPEADSCFLPGDGHIDAPEGENQGRYGEDNGDGGEEFHDLGQAVGYDGGEGVHHRGQNVRIDFGHFQCLFVFNDYVFQKVFVFFVHFQQRMQGAVPETHEPFHYVFIGVKGEVEVGQGFLEFQHAEEFFVLQGFPDLGFDDVGLFVNLLQEE